MTTGLSFLSYLSQAYSMVIGHILLESGQSAVAEKVVLHLQDKVAKLSRKISLDS